MDALSTEIIGDVALVVAVSMLLGEVARRCGQPRVIGQILAGILLGPSLLGRLPGHLTTRLFPHQALPTLNALAQVAVAVFMFGVGYELDRRLLRRYRRVIPLVGLSALLVPLGLGSGAAWLFRSRLGMVNHAPVSGALILFMGVVVSITALPVLAAIIRDRGLAGTPAAQTATAAAGLMDVAAWVVLAAALAGTTSRTGRPWWVTLLLVAAFAAVMLLAVRPALKWWLRRRSSAAPGAVLLIVALTLALGSAWVTSTLGLHAVFGGFLAGLTMPGTDGTPDAEVLRPIEEVSSLLLPLFFVVTGLSVNLEAINGAALVLLAAALVIAVAGKLGPGYLGARAGGLPGRDAATVAVLVNTRGLTELIALNAGLTAGLLSPPVFTVLVIMAVITTAATTPLLALIRAPAGPPADAARDPAWRAERAAPAPPRGDSQL
jgi:Kef-type K+ transport system membrane component KefB